MPVPFPPDSLTTPATETLVSCPHCRRPEAHTPFRAHRGAYQEHSSMRGIPRFLTPRAGCINCNKTFAIHPKSRAITPEKEEAIVRPLNERTSIRGICRALKVSPNTIYATLKKSRVPPSLRE